MSALYYQRRPVYDALEYSGDIEELRAWAATKDTTMSETLVSRIEQIGTDGFQFYLHWIWDENSEFQGQSGTIGDFIVDENNGQLNVRQPPLFHKTFEPIPPEELPEEPPA